MNSLNEMKYFSAVTYDNYTYNFGITPKGEISCAEFGITIPASIIELKPNFVLRRADGSTIYSLDDHIRNKNRKKSPDSLINKWNIPEDVLEYLINNKKIMYCTQMAILYGFNPQHAYDAYSQKRAFKSSRNNPAKRARVLAPFRSGRFN